jgi:hypothetical protein
MADRQLALRLTFDALVAKGEDNECLEPCRRMNSVMEPALGRALLRQQSGDVVRGRNGRPGRSGRAACGDKFIRDERSEWENACFKR